MYERILVALDGSDLAERVFPFVEPLANAFGATLILLQATTPPEKVVAELSGGDLGMAEPMMDPTPILDAEQEGVREYLERVAGRLQEAGLQVQIDEPEGPAADAVLRRAAELGTDLIAMTTHGRTGLRHVIFGSVAESVLHKATCPVLLVRAKDKD
jgi:nucleotide-binding universal stress UspA family protein